MQGFCDSCDEQSDRLFEISRLPEFARIYKEFKYRRVCQACYDDLLEESMKPERPVDRIDDRRGDIRVAVRATVRISGTTREGVAFSEDVTTEDIGSGGLRVTTMADVEVGSVLNLTVPDADFEGTAIVEVIWKQSPTRLAGLKIVEQSAGWAEAFRRLREKS